MFYIRALYLKSGLFFVGRKLHYIYPSHLLNKGYADIKSISHMRSYI